MIKNHIKIAIRALIKNRGISLINITGLALGIASCLMILIYVNDELTYDAFHKDADQLYRITTFESDDGVERNVANAYHPLAPIIESTFPDKTKVVRYFPQSLSVKNLKTNEVQQENNFHFADSLFFDVFSFEFVSGDPYQSLEATNNLVITESTAERYFADENPIGKTVQVEGEMDFVVTGVVKDPPANSTIQFDFVAPVKGATALFGQYFFHPTGSWYYPPIYIFAHIPDNAFVKDWENYQPKWKESYLPERVRDRYTFTLQNVKEMHFLALEDDMAASVRPSFLWVLTAIAFLILAIACINYINLSLTQLIKRFPEMGIRKVLGAMNRNILQQLSVEALLFVSVSLLIGIGLVQFGMPYFNQLTGKELSLIGSNNFIVWAIISGITLVLILIIALFPYFGLARYKIIGILKKKFAAKPQATTSFSLKSGLVVFQFTAAIGLIIATLVIQNQVNFLNQKDLGLSSEQVMVIPIRDGAIQNDFDAVKNTFLAQAGIKSISAISNFPWEGGFYDFPTTLTGNGINQQLNAPTLLVDRDFLDVMNIQIKEGRTFSKEFGTDDKEAFILNESAVKKLNIEDTNGLKLTMQGVKSGDPKEGSIIGIAKDFHMKSLHSPIEPLILTVAPENYYLDNFVIRLETENLPATIANLSNSWKQIVPNRPFEFFFLDDAFNRLYQKEAKMGTIFKFFTMLALFISFMGLLALSALSAQQRTKEIGIRKVLGASVVGIIQLLSKDFLKLVIIALVIVSPIAWYFMNLWLDNFAYHITIQWWIFAVAGLVTLAVAFITVGLQAFKASQVNPIRSLRNE